MKPYEIPAGIIPTRMGTSVVPSSLQDFYKDHPHAYGDKWQFILFKFRSIGSSPRVWGQAHRHLKKTICVGIIPTRMGTSSLNNTFYIRSEDHPHAYGDKKTCLSCNQQILGSSPRVWGQDVGDGVFTMWERIIPTRMGTSQ